VKPRSCRNQTPPRSCASPGWVILRIRRGVESWCPALSHFEYLVYAFITSTPWGRKSNHFSFMNKSFNTQFNLAILLLLYDNRCYTFNFWIYTNFRRLLCKKCDVGYYVINHGVMKLMISVYSFNFIAQYSQRMPKLNTQNCSLSLYFP